MSHKARIGWLYYNYEPLPPRCIRLTRIHRTSTSYDFSTFGEFQDVLYREYENEIRISIDTFPIERCPDYLALSYTWGSPSPTTDPTTTTLSAVQRLYPVRCDGYVLLVTRNLRDALRQIRHQICTTVFHKSAKERGKLYSDTYEWVYEDVQLFWIDALCIDQNDLQERSHQVGYMRSIYRQAKKTLAWLGEKDKYSDDAVKALGRLATRMHEAEIAGPEFRITTAGGHQATRLQPFNIVQPEKVGLISLLCRHWFSRFWVLQEVLLSREVIMVYGSLVCTYAVLEHIEQCGPVNLRDIKPEDFGSDALAYSQVFESSQNTSLRLNLLLAAKRTITKGDLPIFLSIINLCRASECQDPRDRIYSILGITSEFCEGDKMLIEADYTKSVADVFTTATSFIIQKRNDLATLNLVHWQRGAIVTGLPSWCPDYTYSHNTALFVPQNPSQAYRWSKQLNPPTLVGNSGLGVSGTGLDVITKFAAGSEEYTEDPNSDQDNPMFGLGRFCSLASELGEIIGAHSTYTNGLLDIFWRTLFMNRSPMCPMDTETAEPSTGVYLPWIIYAGLLEVVFPQSFSANPSMGHTSAEVTRIVKYALSVDREVEKLRRLDPPNGHFLPNPNHFSPIARRLNKPDWSMLRLLAAFQERFHQEFKDFPARAQRERFELPKSFKKYQLVENGNPDLFFHRMVDKMKQLRDTRMFLTERGRLGIGKCKLRRDDQIWILEGAYAPVCLRLKDNGRYEFVNEVYVHGLMHGQGNLEFEDPVSIVIE